MKHERHESLCDHLPAGHDGRSGETRDLDRIIQVVALPPPVPLLHRLRETVMRGPHPHRDHLPAPCLQEVSGREEAPQARL